MSQLPYTFTADLPDHDVLGIDTDQAWMDKAHADDAAYDLRAAETVNLYPGDTRLVNTGIALAIPEGFAGLVLPRSGLALKQGITVLNAPGLIDPGYRGNIGVILHRTVNNTDLELAVEAGGDTRDAYKVEPGDRIAQLLVIKTADLAPIYYHNDCDSPYFGTNTTERGEGGFGSTGR